MALTLPYRQHHYMGEYANDGDALTFIRANRFDDTKDGTGSPEEGMVYGNTTSNKLRYYNGTSWETVLSGVIDHTDSGQITNVGTTSHADIDTHIGDADKHREIDDGATGTTDLWSASKINSELGALAGGSHRKPKVIDYVDATAAPPTEVTGDRYIIDDQTPVNAAWDGASNLDIVEFGATTWSADTPAEGWVSYVDSENADRQFVDDGTPAWEKRPGSADHNDLLNIQGGGSSERYHLTSAQHTDLTDGGDASSHKHDDRYFTETELGSTTGGSEGASLIGTDTKGNLGGGSTVESALTFLDGQNPGKLILSTGSPNAGSGTSGAIGDHYVDQTNGLLYWNYNGNNDGWVVSG